MENNNGKLILLQDGGNQFYFGVIFQYKDNLKILCQGQLFNIIFSSHKLTIGVINSYISLSFTWEDDYFETFRIKQVFDV